MLWMPLAHCWGAACEEWRGGTFVIGTVGCGCFDVDATLLQQPNSQPFVVMTASIIHFLCEYCAVVELWHRHDVQTRVSVSGDLNGVGCAAG